MEKVQRPIRIVFCHYTADPGGGSDRSLFDLVTQLPRDRFTPIMILKDGDPAAAAYRKRGIDTHELPLVSPRGQIAWFVMAYLPSVLRVASLIRREKADLVHVNTLYNLVGPVAARLSGRPLVWHVREIMNESRFVRCILSLQPLLATRAVAISSAVAKTLSVPEERLRIVRNGIDLSEYEGPLDSTGLQTEFGLNPKTPVVVTVGRIEPWKGQETLIEAAPAVVADCPEVRILVVGAPAKNKPEYERRLRERVSSLGLQKNVIFTGPRNDVPAILSRSDVLVLPSATPEPFGRTIAEAMAARKPVIATAAGGPLDIVVEGETGYLVPPCDPDALAARVLEVLSDPDRAGRMGQAGRARVEQFFSLERLVSEMADLFSEVSQGKSAR